MGAILGTAGRGTWLIVRVLLRVAAGAVLLGSGVLVAGGGVWALSQSGGLWEAMGGVLFVAMGIAVVVASGVLVLLGLRSMGRSGRTIGSPSDGRHGAAYYGAYGGGFGAGGDCGGGGFGGGGGGC